MNRRSIVRNLSTALLALLIAACSARNNAVDVRSARSEDGVSIAYDVRGRGPKTVVFVHGWTCDRTYWGQQLDSLAATYRVVSLDLAGHGASGTGRKDWTIENFASDVAAVVRAVDAPDVVLVGHSLGGPVVLEAALLLPDRVKAVIGIDTFFDFWTDTAVAGLLAAFHKDFRPQMRALVHQAMFTSTSPTVLADSIADAMASARPEIAMPSIEGLLRWARDRAPIALQSLDAPIGVIMAGGLPQPITAFQRFRQAKATLGIEVMPRVGHFLMREDPAEFNRRLGLMLAAASGG